MGGCLAAPLHVGYYYHQLWESLSTWRSIGEEDHWCFHSSLSPRHDKGERGIWLLLGLLIFFLPGEVFAIVNGNGKDVVFVDALVWPAAMCSHITGKAEQKVRYYGYYSNLCRDKRRKENQDEWIPCILEPDGSSKESRKNWARLVRNG